MAHYCTSYCNHYTKFDNVYHCLHGFRFTCAACDGEPVQCACGDTGTHTCAYVWSLSNLYEVQEGNTGVR